MYAAAVFGNRAIAFLNLLLIAYLLDQENFGLYTLLASNALLLQLVLGSWASASLSKFMPVAGIERRYAPLSTVLLGLLLLATIEATSTLVYAAFPVSHVPPIHVAVVVAWSLALMTYEVTLAAQNALGQPKSYAAVALSRNGTALILSLLAASCGLGVVGAAMGQIAGTLLPCIVLPSARRMWRQTSLRDSSLSQLRKQINFGIGGLIASGLYVLFNTLMRNVAVASQGKAAIGQLSLACDLFFVPLALVVNVLFLAKMPQLYILSAAPERHADRLVELQTITRGLIALVLPFMVAGALVADRLIEAVLPGRVGAGLVPLAQAAAVFGGAFALLYAVAMLLLIFDYRRWLAISAIGSVGVNAALQAILPKSTTIADVLWVATAIVLISGLTSGWRFLAVENALPRIRFLMKIASATALMSVVLIAARWLPLLAILLIVPSALAIYGSALWRLRAFDARDIAYFRDGGASLDDRPTQGTQVA